jgi:hypothetical protein
VEFPWLKLPLPGFSVRMVSSGSHKLLILVVSAPIVGLNSENRIKEMVEAVNLTLSEEEINELEEPYVPRPIAGHS